MKIDSKNSKHIIASDGMVLKRISDGFIFGNEVILGKVNINGEIVPDFPENFIEIEYEEFENNDFEI